MWSAYSMMPCHLYQYGDLQSCFRRCMGPGYSYLLYMQSFGSIIYTMTCFVVYHVLDYCDVIGTSLCMLYSSSTSHWYRPSPAVQGGRDSMGGGGGQCRRLLCLHIRGGCAQLTFGDLDEIML